MTYVLLHLALVCLVAHVVMVVIRGPENIRQLGYLRRWRVFDNSWFRIYVHNIVGPDPDRHLHDHPWYGFSIILSGGYFEVRRRAHERRTYGCTRRFGSIVPLRPFVYHAIRCPEPRTWTITFAGPRRYGWGFLVHGRRLHHTVYMRLFGSQP